MVDDAQWLDRESAAVLTFVARRLHADSIAMLLAVRDPWDTQALLADLPGFQLTGLPAREAGQLLRADVPALDDQVGRRIVAETSGNPLALIEVGRELTPGQLAGQVPLPELLPLGHQLEERAADRATTRGGWAASAAFLARAAVLTPDPGTQGRRLLAAARAEIAAGAPDKAQLLLDRSRDHLEDRRQEGLAKKAQGAIYQALNQPAQAAAVLLAAARDLAAFDVRLARAALLDALTAAAISGPLALDGATALELAATARDMPLAPEQAPGPGDLLLKAASTLVLDGHRAAAPLVRVAIAALKRDPSSSAEMLDWLGVGCYLAGALGDDAGMYALARRLERQARHQGALTALATALIYAGTANMFASSLDAAQACFTERGAIEAARDCDCSLGTLVLSAWRGREPMALGLLARSRALLARDYEADALYTEAIDRLTDCPSTVQLARTQLLYGEWLRRRKRRAEARRHLRAAYTQFEEMGAAGFAERTRLELVATGETARKRNPETRNKLTPQEAQIATLASRGATNPEIASKLFISPNTVDYHLRKVFRKLDVTSRRHLAAAALASS